MNLSQFNERKIIYLGLLVHLIAAWFSSGWHHPDEHYQIIEFTRAIFSQVEASSLPMEYGAQIRPSIQVWLAWLVLKGFGAIGLNQPFVIAFLLRFLMGSLSIVAAVKLHRSLEFKTDKLKQIHLFLSLLAWTSLYVHVRFSSETFSAFFFVMGILPFLKKQSGIAVFGGGLLLGLSFVIRFQSGFFLAGLALQQLIFEKRKFSDYALILLGFSLSIAVGILLDRLFYNNWVFTPWEYFNKNILQGLAASFGTEPFYWYFSQAFEKLIPPFSLILIGSFINLAYKKPKSVLSWTLWAFILGHCLVGHKEFRFLFPLAFFLPYLVLEFWDVLWNLSQEVNHKRFMRLMDFLFMPINILALFVVMLKPAHELGNLYRFIYDGLPENSTIVYLKHDPYLSGPNEAKFYLKHGISRIPYVVQDSSAAVSSYQPNTFVLSEEWNAPQLDDLKLRMVYSSFPSWITYLNLNNWLERANCYKLYEVEK